MRPGEEHTSVCAVVERLRTADSSRRDAILKFVRLYGNYQPFGFGAQPAGRPDRLRYNLAAQCVDTLLAELTQSKPKATFLADGGDWTIRQGAKAMDLLVEGQMRDEGIYDGLGRAWLKDAEITGTGVLYVYPCADELKPRVERVFPLELLADDADARYGDPRSLYRMRLMDRAVLTERFPKHAKAIEDSARYVPRDDEWLLANVVDPEADLVLCIEAWHRKSGRKAKDGRYALVIEGATLESDDYDCDSFPFVFLRWDEPMVGMWGYGLVSQCESDQVELNRTLRRIQEAAGAAAGSWLVAAGAGLKVRKAHITDIAGQVLEYAGPPPQYIVPPTVPGDLVMHADRIIQRCLQRNGISEAFATGMKPAGLQSGEAQRVHANLASARQTAHAQSFEAAHVQLAEAIVRVNRQIYHELSERKKDDSPVHMAEVKVEVRRGRFKMLKRLRFDELDLPENAYVLRAYPTSSLPSEPSGRIATVQEWIQAGLIDATAAKALLDFPDTEGAMAMELADYDFALFAVETMLEDGEYVTPEPYQRLPLALELTRRSYLRAVIDGAPQSRLDLLRDHMTAIDALRAKPAQPAAAQASAPMAPPTAPELAAGIQTTPQVLA